MMKKILNKRANRIEQSIESYACRCTCMACSCTTGQGAVTTSNNNNFWSTNQAQPVTMRATNGAGC